MRSTQDAVVRYYSNPESRLGYWLVLGRSQHAGYYDDEHTNEPAAQRNYNQKIADLLELQPGMRLLDAGCGQGIVASFLAKAYDVNVTGITIVPVEVRSAQRTARRQGVTSSTHFELGDYSDPAFPEAAFDRVYTTETLSHAPDVQRVTDALWRVLKPGGRIVCAEYEFDYTKFDDTDHKDADLVRRYGGIHGIYSFGLGQFPKHLKQSGFTDIQEYDWTAGVAPSYKRLERIAKPYKKLVKQLQLERFLINVAVADTYSRGIERGGLFYKVYAAQKPLTRGK